MEESAGRRAAFGVGWSLLTQLVCNVIRLISSLATTRLLFPEVFGILATAFSFLSTLELLSDVGVQPSLVRHPKGGKPEYLMTGWLLTASRDVLLSIIAALSAWPFARFSDEPQLLLVLLALSGTPILRALRSPGVPNLQRNLDFRALFFLEAGQTLIGTVASITFALFIKSVWALVLGVFTGWIAAIVISYWLCPIRPRFLWDSQAKTDITVFGRQILLNTMAMALWMNFNQLLGLRYVGALAMGWYFTAWNLSQAIEAFSSRACDVHFSYLARLENSQLQTEWHLKVSRFVSFAVMPLMALAIPAAPFAIRIMYDPRYWEAGPVLAILLCRLMIRTFGHAQYQYLMARGTVWPATVAYVVALCAQAMVFFPACLYFDVQGMAMAAVISTMVWTVTQAWFIRRMYGGELTSLAVSIGWTVIALELLALV